jgi:hypothetical protein
LEDLPLEEMLLKSSNWKRERQRLLLRTLDEESKEIVCVHCRKKVSRIKSHGRYEKLIHCCSASKQRKTNGNLAQVNSHLYYVHVWCPDKGNCISCIQLLERKLESIEDEIELSPKARQRKTLRNFNFNLKKIICVHCGKEQKQGLQVTTEFNTHKCNMRKSQVRGRLFMKMPWCSDDNCKECLHVEDR